MRRSIRTVRRLAPALLALALAAPILPVAAQTLPLPAVPQDATLLQVSADAEVTRKPDVATVSAGVVTRDADANAAMRANAARMDQVLAAIRKAGIDARDIRTSGINLNPQYRYADNEAPSIDGYQASNTVDLKVRDLDALGAVLDALVASGANQINGPSFGVDQPESAYDEARRKALDAARHRADMYAKALGLRVRRIVSIGEGGGVQPPMPMPVMAMAREKAADTQVMPGENSLGASVTVIFELGR